jgi:hypothetical protein
MIMRTLDWLERNESTAIVWIVIVSLLSAGACR